MTREQRKSEIQLDWATVTYRSIMRGVVYVVLLLALGGLFYYLKASLRASPEDLARREIERAEMLHRDARKAVRQDPTQAETVHRAGQLLTSARASSESRRFEEARAAAQQSIALSEKVLEGQPTDAFTANIFRHEGDVRIKRARQFVWDSVSANTALRVGDQIKTASDGTAQIIYFDGTITTVKPGSLVEIRELFEDPKTKVRKVREKLTWGGVSASTTGTNAAGSFHEVSTESASARTGTKAQFEVSYDAGTKMTEAQVHGGRAEVRTAGKTTTLNSLERVEVKGNKVVKRRRIPDAPRLIEPPDNRVFKVGDSSGSVASLHWAKIRSAHRYRLQISRTTLFGNRLVDKRDLRSTRVRIPGLQEGTYYWRVSAIDDKKVEGPFSEPRKFSVTGTRPRHSEDRDPPTLAVNDFLPSGHLVIINGKTEPGAALMVDGQVIDVYDDGAFTAVVRLKKEGRNELTIVAQDPAGNETRLRRSVFVESF